ncbi:MAG: hypothetical protein QX191_01545, partial [Methylococcaceae bacterium]
PFFPQDIAEITTNLTVLKNEGQVTYYQNELPIFIHAKDDMAALLSFDGVQMSFMSQNCLP